MTSPKTKKPPSKKQKPKPVGDNIKAEVFDKVAAIEDSIRLEEKEMETLRVEFKGSKETVAGLKAQLRRLVWETAHPEAHPLYNAAPSTNGKASDNQSSQPDDESWKNVALVEALVGVKPALLQKLLDAQLTTLGELSAWTAADQGRKRITDIPGVGPAAAQQIEEASTAFWERRKAAMNVVEKVADAEKSTHARWLETPLEKILPCPSESLHALELDRLKTVGDIDARATFDKVPYLEIIDRVLKDRHFSDEVVKAITKASDEFNAEKPTEATKAEPKKQTPSRAARAKAIQQDKAEKEAAKIREGKK